MWGKGNERPRMTCEDDDEHDDDDGNRVEATKGIYKIT